MLMIWPRSDMRNDTLQGWPRYAPDMRMEPASAESQKPPGSIQWIACQQLAAHKLSHTPSFGSFLMLSGRLLDASRESCARILMRESV